MYAFLSKKIAIPNNVKLRVLTADPEHGWIAVGGDDGLLKVLKLDPVPSGEPGSGGARGINAPTQLSMNQSLEGHKSALLLRLGALPPRRRTQMTSSLAGNERNTLAV